MTDCNAACRPEGGGPVRRLLRASQDLRRIEIKPYDDAACAERGDIRGGPTCCSVGHLALVSRLYRPVYKPDDVARLVQAELGHPLSEFEYMVVWNAVAALNGSDEELTHWEPV
jgi:hypothetical protein